MRSKNKYFEDLKDGLTTAIDYERGKINLRNTEHVQSKMKKKRKNAPRREKIKKLVADFYTNKQIKDWVAADGYKSNEERKEIHAKLKKLASNIPAREKWLFKNPEALKSVLRGIEQARQGKVVSRPSFNKKKQRKKKLKNGLA